MKYIKRLIVIGVIIIGLMFLGYLNAYFGWYAYEKWKYRVGTIDMNDSKKRGVFVKELHLQLDSFPPDRFPGRLENFRVYIERGFHFGHESEDETTPLLNSNYPYQVSFNFHPPPNFGILISGDELKKFDSCNATRGYLRYPKLKDTIIYYLAGENVHSGIIRVWD